MFSFRYSCCCISCLNWTCSCKEQNSSVLRLDLGSFARLDWVLAAGTVCYSSSASSRYLLVASWRQSWWRTSRTGTRSSPRTRGRDTRSWSSCAGPCQLWTLVWLSSSWLLQLFFFSPKTRSVYPFDSWLWLLSLSLSHHPLSSCIPEPSWKLPSFPFSLLLCPVAPWRSSSFCWRSSPDVRCSAWYWPGRVDG